jgi:hypothetical protein
LHKSPPDPSSNASATYHAAESMDLSDNASMGSQQDEMETSSSAESNEESDAEIVDSSSHTSSLSVGSEMHISEADVIAEEFLLDLIADNDDTSIATDTETNDFGLSNNTLCQKLGSYSLVDFHPLFHGNNQIYYYQEHVNKQKNDGEPFGGIMGASWRAIKRLNCVREDCMLPKDDAKLMFCMMDHALNSKGQHQQSFFDIIAEVSARANETALLREFTESLNASQKAAFDSFIEGLDQRQQSLFDSISGHNNSSHVQVPKNQSEANSLLLKGRWSLFQSIPMVNVEIINKHAVISLEKLLDHIVAQGVPILWKHDSNGVENNDKINGCPVANELYQEFLSEFPNYDNTAFGFLLPWSDGFQRVYVKQRKNNVWVATVTLLNPNSSGIGISPYHTFCIAIGNSSDDHIQVINQLVEQFEKVRIPKTRYCGVSNSFIKTCFRVLAYSSDRQERDSVVQTLNMGTFGQRFHYAAAIDPNSLPMCNVCFNLFCASLHENSYPIFPQNNPVCDQCCRWDFLSTSIASRSILPPKNYPTVQSSNSPPAPANRKVSESYIAAMKLEFAWMKMGLDFAFHNATTDEYIANSRPRRRARWSKDTTNDYLRTMSISGRAQNDLWNSVKSKRINPQGAIVPYVPTLWNQNTLRISQIVNSPMHIVFHGVSADVMELAYIFLKELQLLPAFERFANKILSSIESLRLEWCKIRELPKTLWLAENILGMTRIMPCIYGLFLDVTAIPETHSKSKLALQQTLNAHHVMVSALMSPRCTYSDSKKIDSYIKMFLSCIQRSVRCIIGPDEYKWWAEKGNMTSLLNLPDHVKQFGPVRWLYEGKFERDLQEIKPIVTQNLRRTETYFKMKLELYQRLKWIKWIKRMSTKEGHEDEDNANSGPFYKGYY